jgi:hypothetical protein
MGVKERPFCRFWIGPTVSRSSPNILPNLIQLGAGARWAQELPRSGGVPNRQGLGLQKSGVETWATVRTLLK